MESFLPLVIPRKAKLYLYYKPHKTDRSLFICCLQKPLKKKRLEKWFSPAGKIASVETGEIPQKDQPIHYAVIEYKKKHSRKKALDNTWLSRQVEEMYSKGTTKVTETDEKVEKHVDKMEEDGFTLVAPPSNKQSNKYDLFVPLEEVTPKKRNRKELKNPHKKTKT